MLLFVIRVGFDVAVAGLIFTSGVGESSRAAAVETAETVLQPDPLGEVHRSKRLRSIPCFVICNFSLLA